jgi:hypothetical protein
LMLPLTLPMTLPRPLSLALNSEQIVPNSDNTLAIFSPFI